MTDRTVDYRITDLATPVLDSGFASTSVAGVSGERVPTARSCVPSLKTGAEQRGWQITVFMATVITALVTGSFATDIEEPAPTQSIAPVAEDWIWKVEPVSLDGMIRNPCAAPDGRLLVPRNSR